MRRPRLTIRATLGLVGLVALGLAVWQTYSRGPIYWWARTLAGAGVAVDRYDAVRQIATAAQSPANRVAIPALIGSLKDPNAAIRRAAVEALGHFPGESERVLPALKAATRDPNLGVRKAAITALFRVGQGDARRLPEVEAVLVGLLDHPDWSTRLLSAEILTALGRPSRVAPVFAAALRDDDPAVRFEALERAWRLPPDVVRALAPALAERLDDPDEHNRIHAAVALSRLRGSPTPRAVAMAAEGLRSPDPYTNSLAAQALKDFGPAARPAVPALIDALSLPDRGLRVLAVAALAGFWEDEGVLPALAGRLRDDDAEVARAAARVLVRIGPPARGVLEAVRDDPDTPTRVRQHASWSLQQIEDDSR